MLNVSPQLESFNDFLRGAVPHLHRAGVEYGDDGWDSLLELAYDVLVLGPIREKHGLEIRHLYGAECVSLPRVAVVVRAGADLLVGEVERDSDPIQRVRWGAPVRLDRPARFTFRQFNHPLRPPEALDALNFVEGWFVEDSHDGPRYTVAEVDDCEFVVEESNETAG